MAVFVPMLLMTSLHVHESTTTVETECTGCIHNSCHGHLTQMASWTHDCVLCQFLTLSFTVVAVVSLLVAHKTVNSLTKIRKRYEGETVIVTVEKR